MCSLQLAFGESTCTVYFTTNLISEKFEAEKSSKDDTGNYIDFMVAVANFGLNISSFVYTRLVSFGGLGVTCSPRDPRFAGSNPTEVDGFFQGVKILSTCPPGGTLTWGPEPKISSSLKNFNPEKIGL